MSQAASDLLGLLAEKGDVRMLRELAAALIAEGCRAELEGC